MPSLLDKVKREIDMTKSGWWAGPGRAYTIRIIGFMTLYGLLLVGTILLFRRPNPPTGLLAIGLAALPALPIIGVFWTIGRLIVETDDEYQRLLLVKQVLVGTALTLSIATVWGFLENFEQVRHAEPFHFAVLWLAMFGLGGAIVRIRA